MPATTDELVQLMFGAEMATRKKHISHAKHRSEAVVLDDITVHGGRLTVEHFTLRLTAGEVVGFAGLESSGQELALRACAGLIPLDHGHVTITGQRMTGKPYRDFMQAGVTFAAAGRLEEGLIAGMTLTEHIALATSDDPIIRWSAMQRHTQAILKQYQVRGTPDNQIETLSGGNQQRLLMGLLPVHPVALILEQPTRGLDVDSARWIWEQLLLRRAEGAALLFSSPELDEIMEYSDRVIVFYAGHAIEVTDPASITLEELGYMIGGKTRESY